MHIHAAVVLSLSILLLQSAWALRTSFSVVKESLISYRQIHGNLQIPYSFVVPNHTCDDIWPAEAKGLKLGNILSRIRTRGDYMKVEEQKRQLVDELGIEVKKKRDSEFETIIEALDTYGRLYKDIDHIENSFVCPQDEAWPPHLQGYRLGSRVHSIRYQGAYSDEEQQKRLKRVGLKPMKRKRRRIGGETLMKALDAYKAKFGDLHVPVKYVVPLHDTDFPSDIRGMPLGVHCAKVRTRGDYAEYRDRLDAMGFQWIVWRDKEFRSILSQLAFQELEALDDEGLLEGMIGLMGPPP